MHTHAHHLLPHATLVQQFLLATFLANSCKVSSIFLAAFLATFSQLCLCPAAAPLSASAEPIYHHHVKGLCRSYSCANSAEASERKLGIIALWSTCGRSGEVGFLHVDGLQWDSYFGCVKTSVPQPKSSKIKTIAFVSAPDRHGDFYLHLGDVMVFNCLAKYENEDANWLLPNTHGHDAGLSSESPCNLAVHSILGDCQKSARNCLIVLEIARIC